MSILDSIPCYPGFEALSTKFYVSAVDATGSDPVFRISNTITSNSRPSPLSIEFLVYSKFITMPDDEWVEEFMGTPLFKRVDVPLPCISAKSSAYLCAKLSSVAMPLTIDGALWSPNMTRLNSNEPLGDMIDRLFEVGNWIIRFHRARAQSIGLRLRMFVVIAKVSLLSPSVFYQLYDHLGDNHHRNVQRVYSVLEAPRNAIDLKTTVFQGSEVSELTCAICLTDIEIGSHIASIPCIHKFHAECLCKWLHKSNTCPICRFRLIL